MFKSLLFFSILTLSALAIKLTTPTVVESVSDEEVVSEVRIPKKTKTRKPSSTTERANQIAQKRPVSSYRPSVTETTYERSSNGSELPEENHSSEEVEEVITDPREESAPATATFTSVERPSVRNHSQSKSASGTTEQKSSAQGVAPRGASVYYSASTTSASSPSKRSTTTGTSSTATTSPVALPPIACSSTVSAGAFTNPIAVGLTCTNSSKIKYCVSNSGCCDPDASGTTYTSNIVIGAHDGTYCLSYKGTGSAGNQSGVIHQTYTINSTLPDLSVTHDKLFYQSTELPGATHLRSLNFNKPNFGVGVINLLSNDPGPSGENLDCESIVTNHATLTAPAPVVIMNFFDTTGTLVTSQLNVPLVVGHLRYGENFITAYMVNEENAAPLYSCSTTKITLKDFDYFEASGSSEDGLAAGFTAYGFYEDETTLNQGSEGASTEVASGQVLETSLYSVFY